MVKDDKQWLKELTENITSQLRQDRHDIGELYGLVRDAREHHTTCREEMIKRLAELDKFINMVALRIGIYVSIVVFVLTIISQFVLKLLVR